MFTCFKRSLSSSHFCTGHGVTLRVNRSKMAPRYKAPLLRHAAHRRRNSSNPLMLISAMLVGSGIGIAPGIVTR